MSGHEPSDQGGKDHDDHDARHKDFPECLKESGIVFKGKTNLQESTRPDGPVDDSRLILLPRNGYRFEYGAFPLP